MASVLSAFALDTVSRYPVVPTTTLVIITFFLLSDKIKAGLFKLPSVAYIATLKLCKVATDTTKQAANTGKAHVVNPIFLKALFSYGIVLLLNKFRKEVLHFERTTLVSCKRKRYVRLLGVAQKCAH